MGRAVGTGEPSNDAIDGVKLFVSQRSKCSQIVFLSFRKGGDNELHVVEDHCSDMKNLNG